MKLLNNDSILGRFFEKAGDIIILNLLFILCSIPIVTAGISATSMYYAFLHKRRYPDTSVTRDFFHSFRQNLKQSTLSWIAFLAAVFIFATDIRMFAPDGIMPVIPLYYLFIVVLVISVLTALYIFPVIAAFKNTLKKLWIYSFFMAARNLPATFVIAAVSILPLYVSLTFPDPAVFMVLLFIWIVCGFGLTAWLNTFLFYRIFRPYLPGPVFPADHTGPSHENL